MIWNPWRFNTLLSQQAYLLKVAHKEIARHELSLKDQGDLLKDAHKQINDAHEQTLEQSIHIRALVPQLIRLENENARNEKHIGLLIEDGLKDTNEIIRLRLLVDSWELKCIKLCHELDRFEGANG